MRCHFCHYDLRNLTENRCPECGALFDPDDPRTYFVPQRKSRWCLLELLLVACVGYFAVLMPVLVQVMRTDALLYEVAQSQGRQGWAKPSFWNSLAHAVSLTGWIGPLTLLPVLVLFYFIRFRIPERLSRRKGVR